MSNPTDTPPAADATPDNVATPGAGGAGDVLSPPNYQDLYESAVHAVSELASFSSTLRAERDALRAAVPFPGMDASNADAIAFHFERDGWSGLTNEATAAWLRSMAKNLRAFEAALARVPAAEKAPGPAGQGDGGRE